MMIGQLAEFDAASDTVTAYEERAQLFFEANDIAENKRVAVFLSAIGGSTYKLLRDLLAPTLPKEKTLDEIVETLKQHFEPKPLVIAERFRFHRRQQTVGETVKEFVAELRRLAKHCEFGSYLDEALRDRFVCGLRSEAVQKKLLTETNLTFAKAVEIAHSAESATENARQLQSRTGAAASSQLHTARDVCKVYTSRRDPLTKCCYGCGKSNHKPAQCPFRKAKCHQCGKTGHIKAVCREM